MMDVNHYLAEIIPQAQRERHSAESAKRTFYEQVKDDISWRSMPAADYERILRAVCDAMQF
jgi:hypothetical protein